MERLAGFETVCWQEFLQDWQKNMPADEQEIRRIYENIRLPKRATAGSAGYDFFAPCALTIKPGEEKLVPTGIRVKMREDHVLMLFPRSSLGFKYRLQLNNTVAIIDSDYCNAENEGHIFCKITNDTHEGKNVELKAGDGMVQGIFLRFGITEDDDAQGERTGGFGSTDKR